MLLPIAFSPQTTHTHVLVSRASAALSKEPEFDLQLAITLAGAAFEAYNEPVEKKLMVRTVNDTKTTFLDR